MLGPLAQLLACTDRLGDRHPVDDTAVARALDNQLAEATDIDEVLIPGRGADFEVLVPVRTLPLLEEPVRVELHRAPVDEHDDIIVSFLDADAQPHTESFSSLPWRHEVVTTLPTVFANVVAQGDSDMITCRIVVNGDVRDEQTVTQHDAQAFCLDKAA